LEIAIHLGTLRLCLNIAKVYGDSISAIVDSMARDTLFVKRMDSAYLWNSGEFISSTYRIEMPIKYVNCTSDYEQIFSKEQISELNRILSNFKRETSVDIAIVTIDSSFTTKSNFDDIIATIHHNWTTKDENKSNGILIGLSKGLRSVRIDNGQGISEKLSNKRTKEIIDRVFIPQFRQGNFFEGTKNGLSAIRQELH